jgi:hypothetical protein
MDQMKSISNGLMRVADLNGKTATLIAEKGHKKAQKLGEDPDIEALREIAAYAETGNKLTTLGVSLVNNRRETFMGSTLEDLVAGSAEDIRSLPTSVLLERVEKLKVQLRTKDLGGRDPFQTINVITGVPARNRTEDGDLKFYPTNTPLADPTAPENP